MNKNLFVVLLWVVLQLVIFEPQSALACSGYPYFGIQDLPTMELLVRATVIDTDDRGYNAILRVEDYYKGEGSRYVTVMRYSPALSTGALLRGYDTGCLYAGRGHYFERGTQGYFGLMNNGDGTYTDSNYGSAHFYAVDGMIAYEEGATEGFAVEFDDPLEISEADFIDLMLEAGEREAPLPPAEGVYNHYPLMRFLNITTESGTRYQVNPDRSVMELPQDYPLAISPDGAHIAFQIDEGRIGFQYIWTENQIAEDTTLVEEWDFPGVIVPGEALRFSNDSNFAAVWDAEQLTIYMLVNFNSGGGYGSWLDLMEIAQIRLPESPDVTLPGVLWSADSTTVVWHDADGLWHWNLVDEAAAQHIMTAADISRLNGANPTLLDVSQHGRFVRFGVLDEWLLIDAATAAQYKNAIISPDERFLIFTDGGSGLVDEASGDCVPPLRDNCVLTSQFNPAAYFFYDVNLVGLVSCADNQDGCFVEGVSWNPAIGSTHYIGGRFLGMGVIGMRQLQFDQQHDQVAIVVGDYDVYFNFYPDYIFEYPEWRPYLDILELANTLDSPIASIEWGQPVFYDMYFLANAEDIP